MQMLSILNISDINGLIFYCCVPQLDQRVQGGPHREEVRQPLHHAGRLQSQKFFSSYFYFFSLERAREGGIQKFIPIDYK